MKPPNAQPAGVFEPELEALYHSRQNERALQGTRVLLVSAAFALMAFGVWDRFIDADALHQTLPVRALGTAVILMLWGGTYFSKTKSTLSWFFFGNTVICTTITAWVLVLVRDGDGWTYGLPSLFFVPLGFAFLPNFRVAAFNCISLLVIVNAVQFVGAAPEESVVNSNIFLSAMCAVTGLFAWVNEKRNRQLFLLEINLERLATTDPLSEAFNRRHFTECSEREIARARRYGHALTLAVLDVDHFKNINDTYGHHVGDLAIKHFADSCRASLRKSDVLGRMGGEEFAVLLPETGGEGARQIAERLRLFLEESELTTERGPVKFTVSCGVAVWRANDDTLEALLQRADSALYEAKRRGRNQVVVSEVVVKD